MKFLNGFMVYLREIPCPVDGESYAGVASVVVPDDDINIASVVKRMQRGEIVPLKQLSYGEEVSDNEDIVDTEVALRQHLEFANDKSDKLDKSEEGASSRVADSDKGRDDSKAGNTPPDSQS